MPLSATMSTSDPDLWKRKLAAFLHDPPHKPFRIEGHEDARASYWNEAHLTKEEFFRLIHRPDDHIAAAADRMIFPHPKSGVRTNWKTDADCAFHHPLSGSKLIPTSFPITPEAAETMITRGLQGVGLSGEMPDRQRWWRLWREWPELCARQHGHFAYLVADTRVPNHTIWQHNGLVSALSNCDSGCAFLLFQIGPVQDFIRQARSTRDLWAGSYLLSYLIAQAMFAVAQAVGPESIVYPQLRGVPLVDWFARLEGYWPDSKRAAREDELLTPNLPNRFLALVPIGWRDAEGRTIAEVASGAVRAAWRGIGQAVHGGIGKQLAGRFPGWDGFWREQTARFPVVDYVIHDWLETPEVLKQAEAGVPPVHGGWKNHPLREAMEWAQNKIAPEHRDPRCYHHKSWQENGFRKNQLLNAAGQPLGEGEPPHLRNQGFVWALHYAAAEWKFAAVKNARATAVWGTVAGAEKDHLDGRNEVLGGELPGDRAAFWTFMREARWPAGAPANLFKGKQEYGALTVIKRLFPYLWLPSALDCQAPAFRSVQETSRPMDLIADAIESDEERSDLPQYYAVLAMDGDDMGKWVSGTRTPFWKDILSGHAEDAATPLGYFKAHWGEGWESIRSPLTPAFHAAMSEALGNFSLHCARPVVEAFHGELIYAGGDDVLAMLPADQALDCAVALQLVFRGMDPLTAQPSPPRRVQEVLGKLFRFPAPGFIEFAGKADKGENSRPHWPFMVMGPAATASVGIAIGHVRSPMQDVIQAAREAEHAAKAVVGKGAFALRVLKRSGESVQFAGRFDSGVAGVWDELNDLRDDQSARFIYRFLQKLKPLLLTVKEGRQTWEPAWQNKNGNLLEIVEAELAHSLASHSRDGLPEARGKAGEKATRWRAALDCLTPENFLHFWMARAFLNRLDSTGKDTNP